MRRDLSKLTLLIYVSCLRRPNSVLHPALLVRSCHSPASLHAPTPPPSVAAAFLPTSFRRGSTALRCVINFSGPALHRSTSRPVYCAQHCNLSADCPPQLSKVVSHPAPEPAKLDKAAATAPSEHKHANEAEFFFSANARCRHVQDTGLCLCPSSSPWSQHQDPNEDDDGIMRCQQICLHAGTTAADTALTAAEQVLVSLANRSEASASASACTYSDAEHQRRRRRVQVGGYGRGYK